MCFAPLCGLHCSLADKFLAIKDWSGRVYTIDGENPTDLDALEASPPRELSGCSKCTFKARACATDLLQLLLGVLLATQLVLGALAQLPQPLGLLLGRADLVPQLLLQVHLLHLHGAVLLLGNLQPDNSSKNRK